MKIVNDNFTKGTMALKGKFEWTQSLHQGGRKAVSFTLTNDAFFGTETFDCAIVDGTGQNSPQVRRRLPLKHGQSFVFSYDSCGWDWANGDFFAILGRKDKILKRWDLSMKIYAPGECPECHGSHRCSHCQGRGYTEDKQHNMEQCLICHGTGICQTCYVPTRNSNYNNSFTQYSPGSQQVGGQFQGPDPDENRQRRIAAVQSMIADLTSKIEKTEWDARMMQLKGLDVSARMAYMAQVNLKIRYEKQLLDAQKQLRQLQNM